MNIQVWEAAMQLPSVSRFLAAITQDLRRGRSVVVLLPPGIEPDLVWDHITAQLYRQDCICRVVDASSFECGAGPIGPLDFIRAATRDFVTPRMSFREAVAVDGCPEVVGIAGISLVGSATKEGTLKAVRRWADEASALDSSSSTTGNRAVCVIDRASVLQGCLPPNGPRLVNRWWWGFPSGLELRLLCRELSSASPEDTSWVECMVSGLAAGDLSLASLIWESCPKDSTVMRELLCSAGGASLLEPSMRKEPRISTGSTYSIEPPSAVRADWAAGRVLCSFEFGIETHPALLAQSGQVEDLEHRLWRGQAPLLLPLVDAMRRSASKYLVQRYGPKWYTSTGCLPEDPEQRTRLDCNPLDVELGYLEIAVDRINGGLGHYDWVNRVSTTRTIRNSLAHYKAVSLSQFRSFLKVAKDTSMPLAL